MRSVVAAGAVMLLALVGLVACDDGGGPDPTPSTSDARPTTEEPTTEEPTTDAPTLTQEELDVEEARQAYVDYLAAYDSAAQQGFAPPEVLADVLNRTTGDVRASVLETVDAFHQYGLVQSGARVVADIEELEYLDDEWTIVDFRVCLDGSGMYVLREGEPQGENGRVVLTVQVVDQGDGWLIYQESVMGDLAC